MKTAEQWIAERVPDSASLRHRAYFTTEDIRKIQADAIQSAADILESKYHGYYVGDLHNLADQLQCPP